MSLRVLHVISGIDPQNGGPTTALLGMVKAQRAVGLDASVLATYQWQSGLDNAGRFRAEGVPTEMIGPACGKLSRHPDLRRTVDSRVAAAADVVHVHGVWEEIQHQACAAARRHGVPYIVTPHGMLSQWNMSRGTWKKRLYLAWRLRRDLNAAAAIHYTTNAERDSVAPLGLRAPPLVETLGIDLTEFTPLPERGLFRAKHPEIAGRRILLFLGRIDYKKGLDLLVPAFAKGATADSVLVLAGPDNDGYGDEIRRLAKSLGLIDVPGRPDRVIFTGMLHGRDRIEALVDAELFLLTSYVENFGVAVVESLAAGTPVIISDQVNLAERLKDACVGEVVPLDTNMIAAAIEVAQAQQGQRKNAGGRAVEFATRHFGWPSLALAWANAYTSFSCGPRAERAAPGS